jgi:hypothetical protein
MTIKIVKDGPMTIKIVKDGSMTIKIAHAHLHHLHNIPAYIYIYKYLGGVADTKTLKSSLLMMYFLSFVGWHRRLNGISGRTQMQFYLIVPAFQKEAEMVSIQHMFVSEQQLTRYQRHTYKKLQGRLTSFCDQYDQKLCSTSDFLRSVGHLYSPAVPAPDDLPDSDSDSE